MRPVHEHDDRRRRLIEHHRVDDEALTVGRHVVAAVARIASAEFLPAEEDIEAAARELIAY